MFARSLIFLLMPATFLPLAAADKRDKPVKVEPFESVEGHYSVKAPGKESTDTKPLAYGPNPDQVVQRTITKWDALMNAGTYSVTHVEFPEGFKGVEPKTILDGARDGVRGPEGLGGKVVSDKAIEVGPTKLPGREVVVQAKKNWVRVRMLLVEARLYQITVAGTEANVNAEAAREFLDSFRVTP